MNTTLKKSRNKKNYQYNNFALAIIIASGSFLSISYADDANTQNTQPFGIVQIKNQPQDLIVQVNNFTNKVNQRMAENSTQSYLNNEVLSSSSTFPLRVLKKLSIDNFRTSPFMPIPQKDFSCYYGVPPYAQPAQFDINEEPITIAADTITGQINENVIYEGNVEISQVDRKLTSDKAKYNQQTGMALVSGNVSYTTPAYTINTDEEVQSSLKENKSTLKKADFQLHGSVARGKTEQMIIDNQNRQTTINDLTFSTCPVGDESWYIKAKEVELSQDDIFGIAKNTMLYVGDIPIFYFPYIKFPTSNERQSGLLYPSFSISSSNGVDFAQPVYLNLAPNYDMTLTPRVMTKRGVALDTEFRFMPIENTLGKIDFNYIPNDNNWDQDFDSNERWMLNFEDKSYFFNNDLSFDIKYQRVRPGDYDFISDFGSEDTNITDDSLVQYLITSYNQHNYNIDLEVRKYQSLLPDDAVSYKPFAMLPQLKASYYDSTDKLSYQFDAEATQFQSEKDVVNGYFNATRLHLEPSLRYQLYSNRGTTLSAGAKGFLTHYEQDGLDKMPSYYKNEYLFDELDKSKDRALYLLELRGKTTLERKVLDMRHTQTLEPEFVYQYIPYRNQDAIGVYDTTDRMADYYSNFSYRHFFGIDRIADTNTVAVGLTSRLLDAHDRELYRFAISQAYSFVPSRVTLYPYDEASKYPRSPLTASFNASPIENVTTHANVVYVNEVNEITAWNAMLEYKNKEGYLGQINYRYAQDANRSLEDKVIDLTQIGLVFALPLGTDFKLIGAAYRDLEQSNNIDQKIALKYEDCCYSISLVYERYNLTDWDNLTRKSENIVGIEFEFKGVGKVNMSGAKDASSTDTKMIDYFNPTNLIR